MIRVAILAVMVIAQAAWFAARALRRRRLPGSDWAGRLLPPAPPPAATRSHASYLCAVAQGRVVRRLDIPDASRVILRWDPRS